MTSAGLGAPLRTQGVSRTYSATMAIVGNANLPCQSLWNGSLPFSGIVQYDNAGTSGFQWLPLKTQEENQHGID